MWGDGVYRGEVGYLRRWQYALDLTRHGEPLLAAYRPEGECPMQRSLVDMRRCGKLL